MRKAFTLIELLIVVAIIAILAAIAVPNFLEAQVRAKVTRAKADMRTFATALETYATDHNKPMTSLVKDWAGPPDSMFTGPSLINPALNTAGNDKKWTSARYKRLTTPVAYLSSVLLDPFAKDGRTLATNGSPSGNYDTYDYWSAYDLHPNGVADRTTADWRGAGVTSGANWRIVSAGPDKVQRFGGSYKGDVSNDYGYDYDPTNGTVSRGDVVRIGSGPGPINPNGNRTPAIDRIQNKYNF